MPIDEITAELTAFDPGANAINVTRTYYGSNP